MLPRTDVSEERAVALDRACIRAINEDLRSWQSLPDRHCSAENDLLLQLEKELGFLVCQYLSRLDHTLELRLLHADVIVTWLQYLHTQHTSLIRAAILAIVDVNNRISFTTLDQQRSGIGIH